MLFYCKFNCYFRYENKGVQWMKSKPSLPPGLYVEEEDAHPFPEYTTPTTAANTSTTSSLPPGLSKAAKKNLKRKEKKKQQKSQDGASTADQLSNSLEQVSLSNSSSTSQASTQKQNSQAGASSQQRMEAQGTQSESAKKLRNLRKKLKQIDDIQAKLDSGEIAKLEKEQVEKLSKRQEIVDEIEDLVFELSDV